MRLSDTELEVVKLAKTKYKGNPLGKGKAELAEWLHYNNKGNLKDLIDDVKTTHPGWNRLAALAAIDDIYGKEKQFKADSKQPVTSLGKKALGRTKSYIDKKSSAELPSTSEVWRSGIHEGTGSVLKAGAGQFGIDLDVASNPVSEGLVNYIAAPALWMAGGAAVGAAAKAGQLGKAGSAVAKGYGALEKFETAGKTAAEIAKLTTMQAAKETGKTLGRKAVGGAARVVAPMLAGAPVAAGMEIAGKKGSVKRYAQNLGMGAVAGAGFGVAGGILGKGLIALKNYKVAKNAKAIDAALAKEGINPQEFRAEFEAYKKETGLEHYDINNPTHRDAAYKDITTRIENKTPAKKQAVSELLGTLEAGKQAKQNANVKMAQAGNAAEVARVKAGSTPKSKQFISYTNKINTEINRIKKNIKSANVPEDIIYNEIDNIGIKIDKSLDDIDNQMIKLLENIDQKDAQTQWQISVKVNNLQKESEHLNLLRDSIANDEEFNSLKRSVEDDYSVNAMNDVAKESAQEIWGNAGVSNLGMNTSGLHNKKGAKVSGVDLNEFIHNTFPETRDNPILLEDRKAQIGSMIQENMPKNRDYVKYYDSQGKIIRSFGEVEAGDFITREEIQALNRHSNVKGNIKTNPLSNKGGYLKLDAKNALENAKVVISKGVQSYDEYANQMKKWYGKDIEPMLEDLWNQSHKELKMVAPAIIRQLTKTESENIPSTANAGGIPPNVPIQNTGISELPPSNSPKYAPKNVNPNYVQLTDEFGNDLTPDAVKAAVTEDVNYALNTQGLTDEQYKRLGVMTWEETEKLARTLNPNPKAKQALNAEQLLALRNVTYGAQEALNNARLAYVQSPTPANKVAQEEAALYFATKIFQMQGATAEAGRALNAMKIIAKARELGKTTPLDDSVTLYDKALKEVGDLFPGAEPPAEVIKKITDAMGDPVKMARIIKDNMSYSPGEKIMAYVYGNILSGIKTHIVNITSNTGLLANTVAIRPAKALVDIPFAKLGKRERAYYAGEVVPAAVGAINGYKEGMQRFLTIMKQGIDPIEAEGGELAQKGFEFSNPVLKPHNYILRSLRAADALFKSMAHSSELAAIAHRSAKQQKLTGEAYASFIDNFMANPPVEAMAAARKNALEATLQNEMGDGMRKVMGALNWSIPKDAGLLGKSLGGLKPMRLFVPFVQVPTNLLKHGLQYSPAGLLQLGTTAGGLRNPESVDIVTKAMVGSTVTAMAYMGAKGGNIDITGAAPIDRSHRDLWLQNHQPYSIKVNGNWYNYGRFGAAAYPLVVAAAIIEGERQGKDTFENVTTSAGQLFRFNFDQSFLQGLSGIIDVLSGGSDIFKEPVDAAVNTAQKTGEMFIPLKGAVNTAAQFVDPIYREYDGIWQKVLSGIPGQSQKLSPKLDVWGKEIKRPGGKLGALFPFVPIPDKSDAVSLELERLRVIPSYTMKDISIDGKKTRLTNKQYEVLKRKIGGLRYTELNDLINSVYYTNLSDEDKEYEISAILSGVKRDVMSETKDNMTNERSGL